MIADNINRKNRRGWEYDLLNENMIYLFKKNIKVERKF